MSKDALIITYIICVGLKYSNCLFIAFAYVIIYAKAMTKNGNSSLLSNCYMAAVDINRSV